MKLLEQAFREQATVVSRVENEVRGVLSDFCSRNNFLLAGRSKDIDSLRDKLETGRYADLKSVDDLVAFSVVIDTVDQEDDVRTFLGEVFEIVRVKTGGIVRDERMFDFDSTRVYCRLSDELRTGVGDVVFEVQIRTLLQHAWSKITHPHVYKAAIYDSRAGRLAAELMAQLEAADRTLARFEAVSKTVKDISRSDTVSINDLIRLIDELVRDGIIPSEMRPRNGRRLGENMLASIRKDSRRDLTPAITAIRSFMVAQGESFPRSVSLLQLTIVALRRENLLERGSREKPRRYYITDELITLFPDVNAIKSRVEVD